MSRRLDNGSYAKKSSGPILVITSPSRGLATLSIDRLGDLFDLELVLHGIKKEKDEIEMRVFKPKRRDKTTGKRVCYQRWYVEFRDHLDIKRRLRGFTDKRQTEEFGRKIEKLVTCRANGEPLDKSQRVWIDTLAPKSRDKLAEIGIVPSEVVALSHTLGKHVDDFQSSLVTKGTSEKQAQLVSNRVRRLVKACKFRVYSDIDADKISEYLSDQRDTNPRFGIQTSNFYMQAIKQFCRWMVRKRRAVESPVVDLEALNIEKDRRHDRRALTVEEMQWLLAVTPHQAEIRGVSGPDRALLYEFAAETGLRAKEIRHLTKIDFDLKSDPATVRVNAAYSKRGRWDLLELRPHMADKIRARLELSMPKAAVFDMPKKDRVAHVLRKDLAAARKAWIKAADTPEQRVEREASSFLVYRDERGLVADFHALRHTFITNLELTGASPNTKKELARHSTFRLTQDRYTSRLPEAESEALKRLPPLSPTDDDRQVATGTDGKVDEVFSDPKPENSVALCVALPCTEQCKPLQNVKVGKPPREKQELHKTPEKRTNSAKPKRGSACIPGGSRGLQNRCAASQPRGRSVRFRRTSAIFSGRFSCRTGQVCNVCNLSGGFTPFGTLRFN